MAAGSELLDPRGFASAYGPTTTGRRSPLFMKDAASCCRWNRALTAVDVAEHYRPLT